MQRQTLGKRHLAWVGVLAVSYALCYAAIKQGLVYAPPLVYAGLRASVGGAALLVVAAVIRRPVLPPRRLWQWIPLLAFAGTFVEYGAMFLSPGRTGAGAPVWPGGEPLCLAEPRLCPRGGPSWHAGDPGRVPAQRRLDETALHGAVGVAFAVEVPPPGCA